MSVASEFPPEVFIPAAARPRTLHLAGSSPVPAAPAAAALGAEVVDLDRWRHHLSGATAGVLTRPGGVESARGEQDHRRLARAYEARGGAATVSVDTVAAPLHLTRRGLVAASVGTALAALAVVAAAWLSAAGASDAAVPVSTPATVTVQSGDSLWSIARAVAPGRDPRAEIDDLRRVNHLGDDAITPGQSLRTR